jgi:thymidine kinase
MAAGKTALVLQLAHQLRSCGQPVPLISFGDRSEGGTITSRLGISAPAMAFDGTTDVAGFLQSEAASGVIEHVVIDEVQFATTDQVDAMAAGVDEHGLSIHTFGLYADFTLTPFPASGRLVAIADEVRELPLATYCWCGRPGRCNARVVDDQLVRTGDTVAIGDIDGGSVLRYVVLCRQHYRTGEIGPDQTGGRAAAA